MTFSSSAATVEGGIAEISGRVIPVTVGARWALAGKWCRTHREPAFAFRYLTQRAARVHAERAFSQLRYFRFGSKSGKVCRFATTEPLFCLCPVARQGWNGLNGTSYGLFRPWGRRPTKWPPRERLGNSHSKRQSA